jgi:peptidoglycan hydrolase CwlO-like protein
MHIQKTLAITPEEQEAIWKAELAQTEADIAKWQDILNGTKANTKSLQNEAAILNAKIKQAQATIKQKTINIEQLGKQIKDKQKTILTLEQRIEKGHESLAQLIRKTNEIDEFSLPEVILGNQDISEFFSDVDSFQSIKRDLQELFKEIRQTKDLTEKEKEALDKAQDKELDTKAAVESQKKEVEKNEKEKQYLIQVNKTQEKTYEQVIAERQKKAGEIRAKLFNLAGGAAAIPFGDAVAYAQEASAATGVRPALILATLKHETNLGQNQGSCFITNTETGDGVNSKTQKPVKGIVKADRDIAPFLQITERLGLDYKKTIVSCPIAGGGWGGGMGPSQFQPSTWIGIESRVASLLGVSLANPFRPKDAIFATALFLKDLGASTQAYSDEQNAACRYNSGRKCASAPAFSKAYGKNIMSLAVGIQADIDYLQQYGVSRR